MAAPKNAATFANLVAGLSLLALAFALSACSAIELRERMARPTAAAAESPGSQATIAAWQAAAEGLEAEAAAASATISAFEKAARPSPKPAEATDPKPLSDMEAIVFGAVPLDSEGLNTIAALALDGDGNLLAATRAGEIFRFGDRDADGIADQRDLVFADSGERMRQVAGLVARGENLIVLHSGALSQLQDGDGDGSYDRLTSLGEDLPLPETSLLANAGLVQAPDGRLFSAKLSTGEILLFRQARD